MSSDESKTNEGPTVSNDNKKEKVEKVTGQNFNKNNPSQDNVANNSPTIPQPVSNDIPQSNLENYDTKANDSTDEISKQSSPHLNSNRQSLIETQHHNDTQTKQQSPLPKNNVSNISERYVVRLRGLPWSAREAEIRDFFKDEKILEIHIVYLSEDRVSGEAFVEFESAEDFTSALTKNRQNMGHRYIEIFKATGLEIDTVAGRALRNPIQPPKSQFILRMRGLPFSATEDDINKFFEQTPPSEIHLIKDHLGRPSGEGFVEFATEVDAVSGLTKHRHYMGHRYIELFRATTDELMKALGLQPQMIPAQLKGYQLKSTCILMRGLPYSCTEADITKFFQEIDVTPVRIHRKADGAEAYVEFYSVSDADKAMNRHRGYIGKRYIELFRVSYDDMARTVGLPLNPAFISQQPHPMNYPSMYSSVNYQVRYNPQFNMATLANVMHSHPRRNPLQPPRRM